MTTAGGILRRIIIVGAADTGRAPIAAALLSRMLSDKGATWQIESAGVVGHDESPAEPEARRAMLSFQMNIDEHRARSLSDELVAAATVLIAIDSGTARVVRARHQQALVTTLGELAGRARDIPDPFRMQVGVWMSYAREIEGLLKAGLPRLLELIEGEPAAPLPAAEPSVAEPEPMRSTPNVERQAALARSQRLLAMLIDLPGVIEWGAARRQLQADLQAIGGQPMSADEQVAGYCAVLFGLLTGVEQAPSAERVRLLQRAIERLATLIDGEATAGLYAEVQRWGETS